MRYLGNGTFQIPTLSEQAAQDYRDNYDRIFGKKPCPGVSEEGLAAHPQGDAREPLDGDGDAD
jgi:hypothetical protein